MINRIETGISPAVSGAKPKDTVEAARQFESLLIAQMLRTARGSEGWLGTGEDSTAASAMEMAEEQFASAMSAQGGLGLAKMIADGLKNDELKGNSSGTGS
jgi:Rod binding domain-containing protein